MTLIVFEGIDGSGKDTQLSLLQQVLAPNNNVKTVTEPGSTALGWELRKLLKNTQMSPTAQLLLFLAARVELLESRQLEEQDAIILCNRYVASTYAYQQHRVPGSQSICDMVLRDRLVQPEITLFIDVPPDVAISRMKKRGLDQLENQEHEYNIRRNRYIELFKKPWHNAVTINGNQSAASVFADICLALREAGYGVLFL